MRLLIFPLLNNFLTTFCGIKISTPITLPLPIDSKIEDRNRVVPPHATPISTTKSGLD